MSLWMTHSPDISFKFLVSFLFVPTLWGSSDAKQLSLIDLYKGPEGRLFKMNDLWVRPNKGNPWLQRFPGNQTVQIITSTNGALGGALNLFFSLQWWVCCWFSHLLWVQSSCFSRLLWSQGKWMGIGQVKQGIVLVEIQLIFFKINITWIPLLANFQSYQKVDSDIMVSFFIAFMKENIFGDLYSISAVLPHPVNFLWVYC